MVDFLLIKLYLIYDHLVQIHYLGQSILSLFEIYILFTLTISSLLIIIYGFPDGIINRIIYRINCKGTFSVLLYLGMMNWANFWTLKYVFRGIQVLIRRIFEKWFGYLVFRSYWTHAFKILLVFIGLFNYLFIDWLFFARLFALFIALAFWVFTTRF